MEEKKKKKQEEKKKKEAAHKKVRGDFFFFFFWRWICMKYVYLAPPISSRLLRWRGISTRHVCS